MKIIILSGGSGKRLWPLSNEVRSKQFLKVVKSDEENIESMLQRVYKQLLQVNLQNDFVIATSIAQKESIRAQIGNNIPMVVEPYRRNTFPAVLLACAYLKDVMKCRKDETIVVMPVDPYVDNTYFETIKKLDKYVSSQESDIVLIGTKPTYPSEKYGYILPANNTNNYNEMVMVEKFVEKPTVDVAKQLIEKDALWNCGIFGFKLEYIEKIMIDYITENTYESIYKYYEKLPKNSFDYEVLEKCKSISVISYKGAWKDLGTWNTLTEVMNSEPIGDVLVSETCHNSNFINELDIPMLVVGVNNMVIVASPDGILVSDKNESSYIKKFVDNIDSRPMFEERSWGQYKVIDLAIGMDGVKTLTKRKIIKANAIIPYQRHNNRTEVWTILSGRCIAMIDGKRHEAIVGDTFSIGKGVGHGLYAITEMQFLEVQVGMELIDDGTEDIEIDWKLDGFSI